MHLEIAMAANLLRAAGMEELKKTPLHSFHVEHGARMVPFAGWSMPVQYTGILEEHRAVREAAGLFDVSHMGEAEVSGPEATRFLNHILSNDISKLKPGRALYALMCYEDGGVVDDVIVSCLEPERFLVCLNAANAEKDLEWMQGHAVGFECTVEDLSREYALLALQGPKAAGILQPLLNHSVAEIPRFACVNAKIAGMPALVSRTGYTGEDGFEFYVPAGKAANIAGMLLTGGGKDGLKLAGLGARDSLRLEAGLPLYGHEISAEINPIEAGLGFFVKVKKGSDFIGRERLAAIKEAGPERRVIHFILNDRRIARPGAAIQTGNTCVGRVLSGTQSPVLGKPIGSALVETPFLEADLEVDIRGKWLALRRAKPPLHKTPG